MRSYLRRKYIITYVFLLSILIYTARVFWGYGSSITVACKLIVILLGLYSAVVLLNSQRGGLYQKKMLRTVLLIIGIAVFYYIIFPKHEMMRGVMLGETTASLGQLNLLVYSLSGLLVAIFLTRKRILNDDIIRVFFVVFCFVSIAVFFKMQMSIFELTSSNLVVNNAGYIILVILPFCFLLKRPLMLLYVAVTMVIALMSAKRGAALQATIFCFFAVLFELKSMSFRKKIVFVFCIAIVSYLVLNEFETELMPTLDRLERDGLSSSGRDDIFVDILNYSTSNIISLLFGSGPLASVKAAGNFAHNDFLEFFASYGMLGLGALFYMYFLCYKVYDRIKKFNKVYAGIMLFAILMCIYKSLISMLLYTTEGVVSMFIIGYIIGQYSNYLEDYEAKKNTLIR